MTISAVSTLALSRQTKTLVRVMQQDLADLQQEVSTGRKRDVAGSIGPSTSVLVDLRNIRLEVEEYRNAISAQSSRLTIMQTAITDIRDVVKGVRDQAITLSGSGEGAATATIQAAARDALQTVQALLNASQSGRFLFGGTRFDVRPVQPADETGPAGLSPAQAVATVVAAAGPLTASSDLTRLLDGPNGLVSLFEGGYDPDGDGTPDPGSFQGTFFHGSTEPVVGRAGRDLPVTYGLTAGDKPVRDILFGLHLLAAVPPDSVPGAVYRDVAERGWRALTDGIDGLVAAQGSLGLQQEALDKADQRYHIEHSLISTRIVKLEEAEPYETALRLNTLQSQLEATFSMTSRLSRLSLVNFL